MSEKNLWPITGTELTRRLNLPIGVGKKKPIRLLLHELHCPKTGNAQSSRFEVDEEMALMVSTRLKRALR